jgi:hypothetical protein
MEKQSEANVFDRFEKESEAMALKQERLDGESDPSTYLFHVDDPDEIKTVLSQHVPMDGVSQGTHMQKPSSNQDPEKVSTDFDKNEDSDEDAIIIVEDSEETKSFTFTEFDKREE